MADTLSLAMVQSPLVWEDPEANLSHLSPHVLAAKGAEVVVLPEMFSTGFSMHPQGLAEQTRHLVLPAMQQWARELGALICGSLMDAAEGGYQNVFFAMGPDGLVGSYAKRHLFTLAGEEKVYRPGKERVMLEWKGWKILPQVCYDLRFPVWSRNRPNKPYDAVVYVANWPSRRITAWDTLLPARAVENMAYCVGVNRTGVDGTGATYPGHSGAWDFLGQPLALAKDEERAVVKVVLHKKALADARAKLGFLNDADSFTI